MVFNGSFSFNGSETGVDFADFLLGVASSYTQGQAESFYNRNLYLAAFAQDSWKATSRLTVNYGVRWDRIRPWLEKFNQLQTLVEGEQSQVFPGAPLGLVFPGDPGVPASLAPPRNNFSPRVGIAYSPVGLPLRGGGLLDKIVGPAGTTSIRLGYGMYYTAYEGLSAGIMSANPPYGYTYTSPRRRSSRRRLPWPLRAPMRASASPCSTWLTEPAGQIRMPPSIGASLSRWSAFPPSTPTT